MARSFLTGNKEIEALLKKMADKEADKISRSALGAGLSVIAKAIKKAAPVGPTGNLRNSIGKRLEKGKKGGAITAKTGINVGKRTKKEKTAGKLTTGRAPHAHLVALGTVARNRKSIGGKFSYVKTPSEQQLSTGTMPANPFAKVAASSAMASANAAMVKQAKKALAKAIAKSKK